MAVKSISKTRKLTCFIRAGKDLKGNIKKKSKENLVQLPIN